MERRKNKGPNPREFKESGIDIDKVYEISSSTPITKRASAEELQALKEKRKKKSPPLLTRMRYCI